MNKKQNLEEGTEKLESGGSTAHLSPLGVDPAGGESAAVMQQSAKLVVEQHSLKSRSVGSTTDPFFSGRKHFPALDGLRGLAILLVLATHYVMVAPTENWFERGVKSICNHGWAGVDLFFVLSGFLITGILYDCKWQKSYFKNFYSRRFLRVFPLYYGFLTVLLLGMLAVKISSNWIAGMPHLNNLWHIQPYLWTYTFNIACAFGHGSAHLGQLWSLSVEEQFYLVWPLIIFVCSRKTAIRVCVALIGIALLLRLALTLFVPQVDVYFFTLTRMDPLAMGALAALLIRTPGPPAISTRVIGAILLGVSLLLAFRFIIALFSKALASDSAQGHSAIIAAVPFWKNLWDNAFIFSVVGIFFVCLLILTIQPGSLIQQPLSNIFSSRPLRTAGKYSYGWYVFHFPLWTLSLSFLVWCHQLQTVHNSLAIYLILVVVNFIASFSMAVGSYHLYEKHFLKLKKYFPERATSSGQ